MKKTKIFYWIITGLMTLGLGIGSIFDLISAPEAVEHVTHIGYPAYIVPFLGAAKLLGLIAIWIPGFPRVKEWAYAGLMYDVVGAMYSHFAFGEPVAAWAPMFLFIAFIAASYYLYHKIQKESKLTV